MRSIFLVLLVVIFTALVKKGDEDVIIQENEVGYCYVDGVIEIASNESKRQGYINPDGGVGVSASWSINVASADLYDITWRYANGGGGDSRLAELVINGKPISENVTFTHTGDWSNWQELKPVTLFLKEGVNEVKIISRSREGLPNIDYFKASGNGVSSAECSPFYTVSIGVNEEHAGSVSYEPRQRFYKEGTKVTLKAEAVPGYFFQSWTGTEPSDQAEYPFKVSDNTKLQARFLPETTSVDPGLTGYATVQDDKGTPYLLTGGSAGQAVRADTFDELKSYLESPEPYVVKVSGKIGEPDPEGNPSAGRVINIQSNKTLLGDGRNAHLQDIELSAGTGVRNVIIRKMKVSHVAPKDAIEINGAKNIWIVQCEFFSDMEHGKDYYDGLLDIKNEASFITVSRNSFNKHFKAILISSGDSSRQDTVIRATFYHNYFYDIGSRLPSIRFGRAHIFNNYYKNVHTSAISSRMGACTRIEKNHFSGTRKAILLNQSAEPGFVQMVDNNLEFDFPDETSCRLEVPYDYTSLLVETEEVPALFGKSQ